MDMDGWYIMLQQQEKMHFICKKIMQSFKEENSSWSSVCVIIIDKDFTECKILKQEFPDATVLSMARNKNLV